MNKEHVFPEWLIRRTGTHETGIRWFDIPNVSALAATLPLCEECNRDFGRELESPTSRLFDEVEQGRGLSDDDAELLIRWMWKTMGLVWIAVNPGYKYTRKYSLRQRVLLPIDDIRPHLVLEVALIAGLHSESRALPMGFDSTAEHDAIFVSGVFSRIAVMVTLEPFENLVPCEFARYQLSARRDRLRAARLFFPPTSFRDDVAAIQVTRLASVVLSRAHDELADMVVTNRSTK